MSETQDSEINNDFYRFGGPYDKQYLIQFIGLIVSDLTVERTQIDKRKWRFSVMQVDNTTMNVEYISANAQEELRLHKLEKAKGSIIFANNATITEFDNTLNIHYDSELIILAMHPTIQQIDRFLKDSMISNEFKMQYIRKFGNRFHFDLCHTYKTPFKQCFFVRKNASFFPDGWFQDKKYLFPIKYPAATEEMIIVAKLAKQYSLYCSELHREDVNHELNSN